MASLIGCDEEEAKPIRSAAAAKLRRRYDAIVLAKGPQSHVVTPDGDGLEI